MESQLTLKFIYSPPSISAWTRIPRRDTPSGLWPSAASSSCSPSTEWTRLRSRGTSARALRKRPSGTQKPGASHSFVSSFLWLTLAFSLTSEQNWVLNFLLMRHLPVCRSCYMVFPSLQLALALSCVMGLVMFARYCGDDHHHSLLTTSKKDAVSPSQVVYVWFIDCHDRFICGCLNSPLADSMMVTFFFFCIILWTGSHILCHGHVTGAAWTSWTVYCMFIQCGSQVSKLFLHLFFSSFFFSVALTHLLSCSYLQHYLFSV